jgi:polar amino acid transport system substrate-binding protein
MRRSPIPAALLGLLVVSAGLTGCARPVTFPSTDQPVPSRPGALVVATTLPAPGFWEGPSAASIRGGFEYAIARELARRLDLGGVRVIDEPVTSVTGDPLPDGVDLALAQVVIGTPLAPGEGFSVPYWDANLGVLVRAGTGVRNLAAARSTRWAYQLGGTGQQFVDEMVRPLRPANGYPAADEAVTALERRAADAVLLDLPVALAEERQSAGRLVVASQFATGDQYAAVLPRASTLAPAIDETLRAMRMDGTIDRLADRWLGGAFRRLPGTIPVIQVASPGQPEFVSGMTSSRVGSAISVKAVR